MKKFKSVAKSLITSVRKSRERSLNKTRSKSQNRAPKKQTPRSKSRSKSRNKTPKLNTVPLGAAYVSPGKEPLRPDYTVPLEVFDPDEEPDFWRPFFQPGEMISLRTQIQSMILADITPVEGVYKKQWSICNLNKQLLKSYHVPAERVFGMQPSGMFELPKESNFVIYNVLLCAALLVVGIVSNKMRGHEFELALKGGKAVQILLDNTPDAPDYSSGDIDVLVLPTKVYQLEEKIQEQQADAKRVAGHLAAFLHWFLNMEQTEAIVSIMKPEDRGANPSIYKLSFQSELKRGDRVRPIFQAMMDIDFKPVPQEMSNLYANPYRKDIHVPPLGTEISFLSPNIGSMLDEKIFYYVKYFKYWKRLDHRERVMEEYNGVQTEITKEICEFMIGPVDRVARPNEQGKFDKAIRALTKGLEKKKGKNTVESYRESVKRRLNKTNNGEPRFDLNPRDKDEIAHLLFP
jgi:hypothetical protein